LLEKNFENVILSAVDTDRPPEQRVGTLIRADHDELPGLGLSGDLVCLEAEQAVLPPDFFMDDESLLLFVHVSGCLATTKISEYHNNFNISRIGKADMEQAIVFDITGLFWNNRISAWIKPEFLIGVKNNSNIRKGRRFDFCV
jgi:hypothetical protein